MKLSVIIPCYNHARYVGAALESALDQSRKPDRVIVIDDGSQDNVGAHETLNRLVKKAAKDCDLVAILNSDDTYLPGRFERCVEAFEKDKNLAVLTTGLELMDDDGAPLDPDSSRAKWFRAAWSLRGREFPEWMGTCNFPATTSNVVARADYLLANPFRPYRFNHDYLLLAKAVIEDRFGLIDEPLVRYRVHAKNTITTAPAPLVREMLRMHLDLAAELAPALKTDAALRARYAAFRRAGWNSISSFDAGMAEVAFADLAARAGGDEIEKLAADLAAADTFPNRQLVNTHDGVSPVTDAAGLSDRLDAMRAERDTAKAALTAAKKLATLRAQILGGRKFTRGRLFGKYKALLSDSGKTAQEKLANFEATAREAGLL